jgi:RHS repeat-associated protein
MVDGTGTNTWIYDAANRVVTNAQLNVQHVVSYSLDAAGNRLSMTITPLPPGTVRATDYAYDGAGRLTTIIDHSVSEWPFRYAWSTNANRLASLDYPSGLRTSHANDALGRKTLLSTLDASQVEIARFAYGHDRAGQRTHETTLTHTDQFAYDAKRQLVSARRVYFGGTPDPTGNFAYDYDPIDNRKTAIEPDGIHRYAVNAVNQYSTITNGASRALGHDGNGNLIDDGTTLYRFDDNDQLAEASNSIARISFVYDGIGRRLVEHHTGLASYNRIWIVYDGALPVQRTCDDDSQNTWVTRGLDFSLRRDGLGGFGGLLTLAQAARTLDLSIDVRGHIRVVSDHAFPQVSLVDYKPFGAPYHSDKLLQPFGFSSKESFPSIRAVDFGKRFYVPDFGRWLTRDPIEEKGGVNTYTYVENDPVNRNDPDGLAACMSTPPDSCRWVSKPIRVPVLVPKELIDSHSSVRWRRLDWSPVGRIAVGSSKCSCVWVPKCVTVNTFRRIDVYEYEAEVECVVTLADVCPAQTKTTRETRRWSRQESSTSTEEVPGGNCHSFDPTPKTTSGHMLGTDCKCEEPE